MRKIQVGLLLYIVIFSTSIKAQYYFYNNSYYENAVVLELGGAVGVMNSLTDLGGKKGIGKKFIKDLNWKNSKLSYGVYATAMIKNILGVKLEGTFGEVQAYDSILKPVRETTFGRYERNLSFKSKITDFQLGLEVHPLFFKNYDDEPPVFSPYLVAGIGYFSFDPQANLRGQWYSLQPLQTEGQGFKEYPDRKKYKLSQVNFAAGIGVKYEINSLFNARVELNHRFLITDYLDDVSNDSYIDPALFTKYLSANQAVIAQQLADRRGEILSENISTLNSQRGNPKDNDAFFTIQLKIGVSLGRERR